MAGTGLGSVNMLHSLAFFHALTMRRRKTFSFRPLSWRHRTTASSSFSSSPAPTTSSSSSSSKTPRSSSLTVVNSFRSPSSMAERRRVPGVENGAWKAGNVSIPKSINEVEATLVEELKEESISLPKYQSGSHSVTCPKCGGGRALNVRIHSSPSGSSASWNCGACQWEGSAGVESNNREKTQVQEPEVADTFTEEELKLMPLQDQVIKYLESRDIKASTLERNGVRQVSSAHGVAIAFPYRKDGKIVGCKYRTITKRFWQIKGRQRIFYGIDDIKNATEIIIVEGEIDKLSMEEAGFLNCVSVPDGAPAKVSKKEVSVTEDKKFEFLWNCSESFKKASRIILATDADPPGQALAEELARRLGRERCWRVKWPSLGMKQYKDANEVLAVLGPDKLRKVVESAELFPIRGLFQFQNFFKDIDDYYDMSVQDLSISTGWKNLDEFYKVVPGELTLVSGIPNSGKSEWIDALICNLNQSRGWKFALCSMENKVRDHGRKLLEKRFQKPFFNASYSGTAERLSSKELEEGKTWLNDNFVLIRCEDDILPSIAWILDLAKAAVMRHGIRGLVIDPYNELDHQRASNQTETEYVSRILTVIKRFAQHHDCHVWFVAHPRQLQSWHGQAPNLYDISGSAHFVNKCDNGLIIHRNRDLKAGPMDLVQVLVRKVRNKTAGKIGDAHLTYDRVTGTYKEYVPSEEGVANEE